MRCGASLIIAEKVWIFNSGANFCGAGAALDMAGRAAEYEKAAAAADEGRAKRFSQKIARVLSGGRRILCAQQCGNFCNIVKLVGFHAKIASFGA